MASTGWELDITEWERRWTATGWRQAWASGMEDATLQERIREATRTGRPAGEEEFIKKLEADQRRCLRQRKRGPKPKKAADERQVSLRG